MLNRLEYLQVKVFVVSYSCNVIKLNMFILMWGSRNCCLVIAFSKTKAILSMLQQKLEPLLRASPLIRKVIQKKDNLMFRRNYFEKI